MRIKGESHPPVRRLIYVFGVADSLTIGPAGCPEPKRHRSGSASEPCVLRYRLSFPLHGLRVSRYRGESASPPHLRDRNLTCTKLKLSKTSRSSSSIPDYESHFGGTDRTHSERSACITSTRAARTAGSNEATTATVSST